MRNDFTELNQIVDKARAGDGDAYAGLVRRFQDMAVGYSFSILGDFALAEDAAQEAFLNAYHLLPQLREAAAFPTWFRRIVFKQCDRLVRRKSVFTVRLEWADHLPAGEVDPVVRFEQQEIQGKVQQAIAGLPLPEREAITLFYISHYSQKEIAAFLELPVSTIKSRLHTGRKRLKEKMLTMIQDQLPEQRPSKDSVFADKVATLLTASEQGDTALVSDMLNENPVLLEATTAIQNKLWIGQMSALHWAVVHQQTEVIDLLLAQGGGLMLLHLSVRYNRGELVNFLLDQGADIQAQAPGYKNLTPLHIAAWRDHADLAQLLMDRGADATAKAGPQNQTPLEIAQQAHSDGVERTEVIALLQGV